MEKFKVGDIVSHCHYNGEFVLEESNNFTYPLRINGNGVFTEMLTIDGKILVEHDKPSISLIRRPKKFETREIEIFGNVYSDSIYIYSSDEGCKSHESQGCLNPDNKKIKITYMVEV